MTIALVVVIGALGGVLAGLFGVGGGILFVPTLALVLGLTQLHAEASSLLAILPTAIVGTWRQRRYGNVDLRAAALIGVASIVGVQGGVIVAESLATAPLRRLFGVLLLITSAHLVWRLRGDREHFRPMSERDDIWIPLVDEPIGSIVEQLQAEHPEIDELVAGRRRPSRSGRSPTSASVCCSASCSSSTTCPRTTARRPGSRRCCASPRHKEAVVRELRAVAEEVAADPRYAGEDPIGPDVEARERFREFARKQLGCRPARLRIPRSLAESGTVRRRFALLLPLALLAFGSAGAEGPARAPSACRQRVGDQDLAARRRRRDDAGGRRSAERRSFGGGLVLVSLRRLDRLGAVDDRERDHRRRDERRPRAPRAS